MIRIFSSILVAICLMGCTVCGGSTIGLDLSSLYASRDTTGLAEAIRTQHFWLRRDLDSAINELLAAKVAHDSSSQKFLNARLDWLCETYKDQSGLSDKTRLLKIRQGWSAKQARSKILLDSTYSVLDSLRRHKTLIGSDLRAEFFQLRSSYETLGDSFTLLAIDYNLSECYHTDGEIDSTIIWLSRCRDNSLELDNFQRAGFCELFFARIHTLVGADYLESERALLRAADYFGRVGDYSSQADLRMNQAYNSTLLFQFAKAIEGYHAEYEARVRLGDIRPQAYCLYALGVTFFLDNKLDSAAYYLERSLKIRTDIVEKYPPFLVDVAYSEEGLGLVMQARGDPDEAHERYLRAEELFLKCQVIEGLCTCRLNHASLFLQEKEYGQARDRYLFILANSTEFENSIHAQFGLALCDYAEGRTETAITNLQRCIQRLEISRNKLPMPPLTAGMLMDKLAYYQLLACIFLERYQANAEMVWLDSAFKYVEVSKAKSLADILRGADSNDDTGEQDRLITLISAHENDLMVKRGDSLKHVATLSALEDSLHAERIRTAKTQDADMDIHPPFLDQASRLLTNNDAVILSYLISEFGSYVFILCSEEQLVHRIELDAGDLADVIDLYLDAISHFPSDGRAVGEWAEYGRTLYEALIPVKTIERLGKKQLIIIPAGRLHYLPFETLIDNQGRYLIESFEVAYIPSVTTLEILRNRTTDRYKGSTLVAFGDPVFAENGATPLKYSRAEVEGLVDLFGDDRVQTYLGEQATETAFKNTTFDKVRYLHLATHGICNERRPDRSALMLAEDKSVPGTGLLHPDEIMSLQIPVDLVFLSACRSGAGLSYPGEGVLSLAQPFLASGARSVVASYWNVDDRIAVQTVASFYSGLAGGDSKIESLANAKRVLINSERELYRHPYYWAPFVLVGEYD